MAKLGDFFPEAERAHSVARSLKPGQIVYLYCAFITPPKDKYLLLLCRSAPPLLFMINSRIPAFVQARENLRQCQVRLDPADYSFLDHESWLDCSRVINQFDDEEIVNQVMQDSGRVKGPLKRSTKDQVARAVERARTISTADKSLIVSSLR